MWAHLLFPVRQPPLILDPAQLQTEYGTAARDLYHTLVQLPPLHPHISLIINIILAPHLRPASRSHRLIRSTPGLMKLIDFVRTMNISQLQKLIERYFTAGPAAIGDSTALDVFIEFRGALERGEVRSASPDAAAPTGWRVNQWVKQGILLGFRLGALENTSAAGFSFVDKSTYPMRHFAVTDGIRIVPGGSSVRAGAYLARGVVCMPPTYINTGAWVDEGTMVDSHALVGSCAQIGKRVHLSAAAQIGGVLEPINASPVIIEDDVLVGGNCGVYEGTLVRAGAVLAPGTILTRGTPLFDLVNGEVIRATDDNPLIVPPDALVVPGSRAVNPAKAHVQSREWGLSLYAPVIVKYRDDKTSLSTALEELLR